MRTEFLFGCLHALLISGCSHFMGAAVKHEGEILSIRQLQSVDGSCNYVMELRGPDGRRETVTTRCHSETPPAKGDYIRYYDDGRWSLFGDK